MSKESEALPGYEIKYLGAGVVMYGQIPMPYEEFQLTYDNQMKPPRREYTLPDEVNPFVFALFLLGNECIDQQVIYDSRTTLETPSVFTVTERILLNQS